MSDSGQILRRSIGIVFADGGLLALTSALPAGAGEHGEEEVAAVLCDPDAGPVTFDEVLLSTEYGEDGVQRRATLELWPAAARGRHADQLDLRAAAQPERGDRLLPLVGRGARGARPLRGGTPRWLRSRQSSPTSAAS